MYLFWGDFYNAQNNLRVSLVLFAGDVEQLAAVEPQTKGWIIPDSETNDSIFLVINPL